MHLAAPASATADSRTSPRLSRVSSRITDHSQHALVSKFVRSADIWPVGSGGSGGSASGLVVGSQGHVHLQQHPSNPSTTSSDTTTARRIIGAGTGASASLAAATAHALTQSRLRMASSTDDLGHSRTSTLDHGPPLHLISSTNSSPTTAMVMSTPPMLRAESRLRSEQATFGSSRADTMRLALVRECRALKRESAADHGVSGDVILMSLERIAWNAFLEKEAQRCVTVTAAEQDRAAEGVGRAHAGTIHGNPVPNAEDAYGGVSGWTARMLSGWSLE